LSKLKTAPKKTGKRQSIDVVVTLTAQDHKEAVTAASLSHQTVADWISTLVNTALQP
jgi:hypothetical protein